MDCLSAAVDSEFPVIVGIQAEKSGRLGVGYFKDEFCPGRQSGPHDLGALSSLDSVSPQ